MDIQARNSTALAFMATAMLAIAAGTSAVPALAASPAPVAQQTLSYSHLDLNSTAGVRNLYGRIRKAAEAVCGPRQATGSRVTLQQWRDCRDRAVSEAVARLDKPALNAYHRRRAAAAG